MNIRKKISCILFFVIFIFSFAFSKVENSKGLIEGQLSNGMKYYLYKNKMPENRASVNVLVRAGSLQEDDDQKGMAHLIEHMCFNGTEKYDKNEVVKYYQSIGLQFGGDLNAHTSFDETVYKIQIPTDDREKFEKGIEVLKEMTINPTFKQENIDSEKNIIVEEWRLGQGLSERITKVFQNSIFEGSRYKDRFPIGDMDIIRGTKKDVLKRYYDRWYQPENMAVVVVGDFDVEYTKNILEKYFNLEKKEKFVPREEYRLKELSNKYVVFQDKEMTSVVFEIVSREDISEKTDEEKLNRVFENILLQNIISNRVNDEINSGNNFIYGGEYYTMTFSKDRLNTFATVLNKNSVEEGIRASINILKDIAVNGISEEELEIEKMNIKKSLENQKNNMDSITNEELIGEIRQVFLNDTFFLNSEDSLKYYEEYVKSINSSDIKKLAENFYNDNHVTLLLAPQSDEIKISDEKNLEMIVTNIKNEKLLQTKERKFETKLNPPMINKGSIKSIVDMKEYKKITLSNGIEILYKETDFDKDKIFIKLFREGGNSLENESSYLNSKFAADFVSESGAGNIKYEDLNSFMKGKEFAVTPYINDFEEGVIIISNNGDLKTALDYFTYVVKEPKISDKLYDTYMTLFREKVENRKNSPDAVYSDKITEILFNNDFRKKSLVSEDISKFSKEKMLEEYKDRFTDFGGYKGVIVGAISEEKAKEIAEKYFASLPVENKNIEAIKKIDIKYPQNIVKESVKKGVDKKVKVTLYYPLKTEFSNENIYMEKAFEDILRINLIDEVREKMGGVYGISPFVMDSKYENGLLRIRFSTDPEKVDKIIDGVKNEVNKLIDGNIKKSSLDSIKKNYKLVYENSQKQNSYWVDTLYKKLTENENYKYYTPYEYNQKITEENLVPFFKKLIDKDNCIQVILIPERYE